MKYDFDKMNVRIQVINPGFIDTALTEKNMLPMPGLMPVNRASRRMARGIESRRLRGHISAPAELGAQVVGILPRPVCRWSSAPRPAGRARPLNYDRKLPNE